MLGHLSSDVFEAYLKCNHKKVKSMAEHNPSNTLCFKNYSQRSKRRFLSKRRRYDVISSSDEDDLRNNAIGEIEEIAI
ncbi:hypothetical protein PV325_007076, partial [Microctonus aethiopoides]